MHYVRAWSERQILSSSLNCRIQDSFWFVFLQSTVFFEDLVGVQRNTMKRDRKSSDNDKTHKEPLSTFSSTKCPCPNSSTYVDLQFFKLYLIGHTQITFLLDWKFFRTTMTQYEKLQSFRKPQQQVRLDFFATKRTPDLQSRLLNTLNYQECPDKFCTLEGDHWFIVVQT